MMYDAAQLAEEIEEAISNLGLTIGRIQVTEGFLEVLDAAQLNEVDCAALRLSLAVTKYLTKAIIYLENTRLSINTFVCRVNFSLRKGNQTRRNETRFKLSTREN